MAEDIDFNSTVPGENHVSGFFLPIFSTVNHGGLKYSGYMMVVVG